MSLIATQAIAERSSGMSSEMPDSRTLSIQRKVEKLFDKGDFKRAHFIYRNELAPIGDKYAQYMVGFMYDTGLGVEKDVVSASAWYRLAAERDTPEFVTVRDRHMRAFNEEQQRRSDLLFFELRVALSDMAVLVASIKYDIGELDRKTGSRLGGETSPIAVINARSGAARVDADYYRVIERRIEDSLERLASIPGFENIDTDRRSVNVNELERKVREYLQTHH